MVPQLLQDSHLSVVCAVAEVALRLLFSRKVVESEWIGKLVFLFFDPCLLEQNSETNGECGDGINDVGNPERLQQMLSLFFPAFCLKKVLPLVRNSSYTSFQIKNFPRRVSEPEKNHIGPFCIVLVYFSRIQ